MCRREYSFGRQGMGFGTMGINNAMRSRVPGFCVRRMKSTAVRQRAPKGRGAVSTCGSAAGRDEPPPARSQQTAYPAERAA